MEIEDSIGKDATSDETLEDLEENEDSVEEGSDTDMPSPDGSFDDAEELKDADPV